MADNFDMKKFLFENKLGSYARNTVVENQEEGYMGTQYDSSEDMAADMAIKGITEKYQPGDMWSTNFDYKGMLKSAANLSVSSPEELMQAISDSFEDVNYHRENSHLQDAIEAKKENDNDAIKFHLALFKDELKKTIKNLKETQIFEREKVEEGEAAYEYEKGKAAGEKEEENIYESRFSRFGARAGLSKEETLEVAQKFADAMSKAWDADVKVNMRTLEEDSFDLDYNGEEYDGGSYNIYKNGDVVNLAVTDNPIYGKTTDNIDTIAKNMKQIMDNSEAPEIPGFEGTKNALDAISINEDQNLNGLSPEMFERMDSLASNNAKMKMISAAETIMNELTDDGFEVLDVRKYFSQLIANDI